MELLLDLLLYSASRGLRSEVASLESCPTFLHTAHPTDNPTAHIKVDFQI